MTEEQERIVSKMMDVILLGGRLEIASWSDGKRFAIGEYILESERNSLFQWKGTGEVPIMSEEQQLIELGDAIELVKQKWDKKL